MKERRRWRAFATARHRRANDDDDDDDFYQPPAPTRLTPMPHRVMIDDVNITANTMPQNYECHNWESDENHGEPWVDEAEVVVDFESDEEDLRSRTTARGLRRVSVRWMTRACSRRDAEALSGCQACEANGDRPLGAGCVQHVGAYNMFDEDVVTYNISHTTRIEADVVASNMLCL